MQIGTLILGIVIGVVLAWVWLDREGLKDHFLGIAQSGKRVTFY